MGYDGIYEGEKTYKGYCHITITPIKRNGYDKISVNIEIIVLCKNEQTVNQFHNV